MSARRVTWTSSNPSQATIVRRVGDALPQAGGGGGLRPPKDGYNKAIWWLPKQQRENKACIQTKQTNKQTSGCAFARTILLGCLPPLAFFFGGRALKVGSQAKTQQRTRPKRQPTEATHAPCKHTQELRAWDRPLLDLADTRRAQRDATSCSC